MDHNEQAHEVGEISEPTAAPAKMQTRQNASRDRIVDKRDANKQTSLNSSAPGLLRSEEKEGVMHDPADKSVTDDCTRIKGLGYSPSHHIRMYGQRFDIVSDPFPSGTGVAVEVTTLDQPKKRVLRLPTSILVGLKDLFEKAK